jgi:hypothetical protein
MAQWQVFFQDQANGEIGKASSTYVISGALPRMTARPATELLLGFACAFKMAQEVR